MHRSGSRAEQPTRVVPRRAKLPVNHLADRARSGRWACWRKLTLTGRWRLVDGDAPGSFVRAREAQLMAVRIADMEIPLAPRRVGRRGCRCQPPFNGAAMESVDVR